VHQDDQRPLLLVLHDQGLDYRMLGHAERSRRGGRAAAFFIAVFMFGERHTVPS
jgi:hypothetical protein